MENEWYEVETEAVAWDRHTLISKWGQKNKNHPQSADNLMSDLYEARASTIGKTGDRWWGDLADVEGVRNGSNTCNILNGTDGNQFPPFVDKADPLWIFNSAPCRSIFLIYTRDVVVEAIPTLEYSVPKDGDKHVSYIFSFVSVARSIISICLYTSEMNSATYQL